MTVGGMGFIPERLLMMMMMNTGTLCKMYTIPVIIPTVNIHSLVCTTLANTLDCAKLYINCYINPVNVSHFEFALWSKDNTLLCPSHCQLALHVSASFAARRVGWRPVAVGSRMWTRRTHRSASDACTPRMLPAQER